MPVTPNVLERLLLFRLNKGPGPVLDLLGAAGFKAMTLAIDLGVFDTLAHNDLTAAELADYLDVDERGINVLLNFLSALGYVTEDNGVYRNTQMTTKWLTTTSDSNMAPWFTFWNELAFPFWDTHLESTVKTGNPPHTIYDWFDEEPTRWDTAQQGFRAVARVIVDEVCNTIRIPDSASRLLDVGGGHGLYSITLCEKNPSIQAAIFDNPKALDVARTEIENANMSDRVSVVGGDYWTDDLGSGFDIAFIFNIVHAHSKAENERLFKRVGDAINPGGRMVILD